MQAIKFIADKNNLRLDHYLVERFPEFSRSKIKNYINSGDITINDKVVKPSFILKGEEKIKCLILSQSDENSTILPENIELNIIYEDNDILAINKPRGLVVHPGNGNKSGTLLNSLIYHYKNLSRNNSLRPGIIHRLDKNTSGVILIAKKDYSHDHISKQFLNRTINKYYSALVWGKIPNEGVISNNIGRNRKDRTTFKVVNYGGRESITHYKMGEFMPPFSLIEVKPETGRTHQIRVHLDSIGYPILGDENYGGGIRRSLSYHVKYKKNIKKVFNQIKGFALHAHKLEITHPTTNKKVKFKAPIPQDIKNIINILRDEQF